MTDEERQIVQALAGCTFLPGSWDQRFVKGLAALPAETALTGRQREQLCRLAHRYRRQVGTCLVDCCPACALEAMK